MNIFLSYASEDREIADEVRLALGGGGHQVFFDRESLPAAGDFHTRIRTAVERSDVFVFLASPDSVAQGSYALTELKYARVKWSHPKGRVLPVRVGDTPWEAIPAYLKAVTVLEPEGNMAAEVLLAVSELEREIGREQGNPADVALEKAREQPPLETDRARKITDERVVSDRKDVPEPAAETDSPTLESVEVPLGKRALVITMIHETGKSRSYTAVYVIADDLSYGQCFASLGRGSLHSLVQSYCDTPGARFAPQMKAYLPRLKHKDPELQNDEAFKALLARVAGEDPIMVKLQDQLVEDGFFGPARTECTDIGVRTALGYALIADTIFHVGRSRYERIKLATIKALDGTPATAVNEQRWLRRFADERIAAFGSRPLSAGVKMRTATYVQLMMSGKWDLAAPVAVGRYQLVDP